MLRADNRHQTRNIYLEELGNLLYVNPEHSLRSEISFSLYQPIARHNILPYSQAKNRLYKLVVEKKLALTGRNYAALTVGRIQRADSLGFYYLDGAKLQVQVNDWFISSYIGKPGRIEDFRGVSGELLSGLEINTRWSELGFAYINALQIKFGWQHYRQTGRSVQERINFALRSSSNESQRNEHKLLSSLDVFIKGTWLPEIRQTEDVQAGINSRWYKNLNLRIWHETYRPQIPYLTFRERFYSVYSRGYQKTFVGEVNYMLTKSQLITFRRRQTRREFGGAGYGSSIGYRINQAAGVRWRFQYDYLNLNTESAESCYLEMNTPLSPSLRARFGVALQEQQKSLYGKNNASAFELNIEKMIRANLFAKLSSSYIFNSRMQNEYRLGFRLDYYFDGRTVDIFSKASGKVKQ